MRAIASFASGRRRKWWVLPAWVVLAVALGTLGAKLGKVTNDNTESFLPKGTQSAEVLHLVNTRFGGQTQNGLLVYRHRGGLTGADRAKIARDAAAVQRAIPVVGDPVVAFAPGSPKALVSPNGELAYTVLAVPDNNTKVPNWGKSAKAVVHAGTPPGLQVYVTGSLGFNADANAVFGSLDAKLLLITVALVIVLLGAIYRSPVVALLPLVVVALAYEVATGLIYLYAKSGATVSTNSTSILIVLMFGVGTDYCLLLVSRYREELRVFEDKHQAMDRALRRAGPALVASGTTVAVAMLVLLVAQNGSVNSLGPVAAIGVASVLLSSITLLPALLTITGRRGFWPRRGSVAHVPGWSAEEHRGWWRRFGDRAVTRPRLALGATVTLFAVGALGLLSFKEDYSVTHFFKKTVESVEGFKALQTAFPAGALAPTTVLVLHDGGAATAADVAQARRRLSAVPDVQSVSPLATRSRDGRIARLTASLGDDPYQQRALDRTPLLRASVARLAPGAHGLVGDGSALYYDYNRATTHDIRVIVPLTLAVIAVILGLLLQAVAAPIVLIATVVLSFFGTFGMSLLFFRYVVGDSGVDNSIPVFAFIFLVALGTDYTIFLMSRVREEARTHGTREGVLRALGATGSVITSAGLILAGTFSVLMTLPVTFTFDLGFMVAAGILLDTFIVRTVMVPAAVELVGERIWWPSTARGGRRALGDHAEPERARAAPAGEGRA